jgi:hypothetical protein
MANPGGIFNTVLTENPFDVSVGYEVGVICGVAGSAGVSVGFVDCDAIGHGDTIQRFTSRSPNCSFHMLGVASQHSNHLTGAAVL